MRTMGDCGAMTVAIAIASYGMDEAGTGAHRPAATVDSQPRDSTDPVVPRSSQTATWSSQVRTRSADGTGREYPCGVCAVTWGILTGDSTMMLGMLLLPEPGRGWRRRRRTCSSGDRMRAGWDAGSSGGGRERGAVDSVGTGVRDRGSSTSPRGVGVTISRGL